VFDSSFRAQAASIERVFYFDQVIACDRIGWSIRPEHEQGIGRLVPENNLFWLREFSKFQLEQKPKQFAELNLFFMENHPPDARQHGIPKFSELPDGRFIHHLAGVVDRPLWSPRAVQMGGVEAQQNSMLCPFWHHTESG
jgi:hypothetical protein